LVSKLLPGKAPKAHVAPGEHSAADWAVEQHVSAHELPAQSPDRQSESAVQPAPPRPAPNDVLRPSHSGRTHRLPPVAVAKHTVDPSQSAEVQHGWVQNLDPFAALYTLEVTVSSLPHVPL